MQLYTASVIPFNASSEFFAVLKHDYHLSPVIHLLLIIEALGVRLFGWHSFSIRIICLATMLSLAIRSLSHLREGRSYQFSIHHTSSNYEVILNGFRARMASAVSFGCNPEPNR